MPTKKAVQNPIGPVFSRTAPPVESGGSPNGFCELVDVVSVVVVDALLVEVVDAVSVEVGEAVMILVAVFDDVFVKAVLVTIVLLLKIRDTVGNVLGEAGDAEVRLGVIVAATATDDKKDSASDRAAEAPGGSPLVEAAAVTA